MKPSLTLTGLLVLIGAVAAMSADRPAPAPAAGGPHLLVDDFLIAASQGIVREIQHPRKHPGPVVTSGDGNWQPYCTVLRDPDSGRFRIWYNARRTQGQGDASVVAYMESDDGLHWERPPRIVWDHPSIAYGVTVIDEGKQFRPRQQRYKLGWWGRPDRMQFAASPDGLDWTMLPEETAIHPVQDIVTLYRDPGEERYLAFFKLAATEADGYLGRSRTGGIRRLVGHSISSNLRDWTPPTRLFIADKQDAGITEFYNLDGIIKRGGLYIGLLRVLRDDLPAEQGGDVQGIGYTVLAYSRDGVNWRRDRQAFLDRTHEDILGYPGADPWDHAHAWGSSMLVVRNEIYLYYGGYRHGHKVEPLKERQLGLARFPRDRFVARAAGDAPGTLLTRPLVVTGDRLTLNADAKLGEIRARLLRADGRPLPGYSFEDCRPMTVDALDFELRWKRPFRRLKGQRLQIEFRLQRAKIFAFGC